MLRRLFSVWRIIPGMILVSSLLSAPACFRIVEGESSNAVPTKSASTTRGIVGRWSFDNNAFDTSGLGNNGSVIGGATFIDSMPGFGKALSSGIRSYGLRVNDSASLDIDTALTLEAWIKLEKVSDRSPVVSKVDKEGFQNSYQLQVGADGHAGMSVWKAPDATTFLRGDTLLNLGQWYHLSGSYEYVADGTSVMKVFVNGKLDGKLTNAVGPIFVGTGDLMIGRLDGAIDEVHVWNTPYASYSMAANPKVYISQHGTSCTIKASVTPVTPDAKVNFEFLQDSVNSGNKAGVSINDGGVAQWTYSDTSSKGGVDTIRAWIDRDWSGSFEAANDVSVVLREIWTSEFVTAVGNIMDGNVVTWTFEGAVGTLGLDVVGEFELVDHVRKVTYHSDTLLRSNTLFMANVKGLPASSPPDGAKTANFVGTFTNNVDDSTIYLVIWMVDAGEPGANNDQISVKTGPANLPAGVPGAIWIGTQNPDWTPPPPVSPYALPVRISSGNIKVHNIN